jgi:hypothetical protein
MADRYIRRHVDKQDEQVIIRRVATDSASATPAPKDVREPAREPRTAPEPRPAGHRITRTLRKVVSR